MLGSFATDARRADRGEPAARRQPPGARARAPAGRRPRGRRARSSSGSPPTTSPRSRATCCGWARWRVLAQVCALLGDRERARASSTTLLLPYRDRNVMIGIVACWGSAERFLGLLAADRRRHARRRALRDRDRPQRRGGIASMVAHGPRRVRRRARGRGEGEPARALRRDRSRAHPRRSPRRRSTPGTTRGSLGSFPMVGGPPQHGNLLAMNTDARPSPAPPPTSRSAASAAASPTTSASTRRSPASASSSRRSSPAAPARSPTSRCSSSCPPTRRSTDHHDPLAAV